MRILFRVFVFCSACFIGGCKKKEVKYYPIADQILRDAVDINVGSYFVYYNSFDNKTDTFKVDGFDHGDRFEKDCNGVFDGEFETMTFVVANDSDERYGIATGGCGATDKIVISGRIDGRSWYAIRLFSYPFSEHTTVQASSEIVYQLGGYYQNFVVSGQSYSDVYELTTVLDSGYEFHSYYSLRNGLVRYILKQPGSEKTFDLIGCKIVK